MRRGVLVLALALALPAARALGGIPDWLERATARALPDSLRAADAVTLLHEDDVRVAPDGSTSLVERQAVHVGTLAGKTAAVARVVYRTDTGHVRGLQAWLLRPGRAGVRVFGAGDAVDLALLDDDVYNEVRVRAIAAGDAAEPGSVFAWEAERDDLSPTSEYLWAAQDRLPTLVATCELTVPAGWAVTQRTLHHADVELRVADGTYRWWVADLPGLPDEPGSPPLPGLAPCVAMRWSPPAARGPSGAAPGPGFSDWRDVAAWLSDLVAAPCAPSPPVAAKASALVVGAANELDSLRAIARYVQSVRYAEIAMGTGSGGGYRPHAASDVLVKGYGDCKDKAGLMRAMLDALGVPAWLLMLRASDPDYVSADWPSPECSITASSHCARRTRCVAPRPSAIRSSVRCWRSTRPIPARCSATCPRPTRAGSGS